MDRTTNGVAQRRTGGYTIGSTLRPLATLLCDLWAAYWAYQLRRATARMLRTLDDRMLKDIGFPSTTIEEIRRSNPRTTAIDLVGIARTGWHGSPGREPNIATKPNERQR